MSLVSLEVLDVSAADYEVYRGSKRTAVVSIWHSTHGLLFK